MTTIILIGEYDPVRTATTVDTIIFGIDSDAISSGTTNHIFNIDECVCVNLGACCLTRGKINDYALRGACVCDRVCIGPAIIIVISRASTGYDCIISRFAIYPVIAASGIDVVGTGSGIDGFGIVFCSYKLVAAALQIKHTSAVSIDPGNPVIKMNNIPPFRCRSQGNVYSCGIRATIAVGYRIGEGVRCSGAILRGNILVCAIGWNQRHSATSGRLMISCIGQGSLAIDMRDIESSAIGIIIGKSLPAKDFANICRQRIIIRSGATVWLIIINNMCASGIVVNRE